MLAGQMRVLGRQSGLQPAPMQCTRLGSSSHCGAKAADRPSHRQLVARRQAASRGSVVVRAAEAADRLESQVAVVLGSQWGDEGKGKLVDILAQQYDVVARAQVSYLHLLQHLRTQLH